MDRYQFGDAALAQMRPHGLELGAVRQGLAHLNGRVGSCVRPLGDQLAVLSSGYYLPLHNTAFFQPFGSVLPNDVFFLPDEMPDRVEELPHQYPPHAPARPGHRDRVPDFHAGQHTARLEGGKAEYQKTSTWHVFGVRPPQASFPLCDESV